MKKEILCILSFISLVVCHSQTTNDFNDFRNEILNGFTKERESIRNDYNSFRENINAEYSNFLRNAWSSLSAFAPIMKPKDSSPVPPVIFDEKKVTSPITIDIKPLPVPKPYTSPKPVVPIEENGQSKQQLVIEFYGLTIPVRIPEFSPISISNNENEIAAAWDKFSDGSFENSLCDLQSVKTSNDLCDWAYMQMVKRFSTDYFPNSNAASLLTAWFLCQSGYQIRIAKDSSNIIVLYASNHTIFDQAYFIVDGMKYYPLDNKSSNIKICNAVFKGETPLSLSIPKAQKFGEKMSEKRVIKSSRYPNIKASVSVNKNLIDFYNNFPTSAIGGNPLSRWAIYANTPFDTKSSSSLYSQLNSNFSSISKLDAVEIILNWVQTGFEYEYDDIVWGHDRAFFAEETLFYPYADCEDRSILFSHLVRELLGLEVALIYYPGHLATAVSFNEEVSGDAVNVNGKKFIICDPTYIGAPVGAQMPNLEYDKIQAIVLNSK
ncbi:MAG: transglutaminase domain-containing protein [Bacteroides sp.]|nr:transglutaminase domain-containing protein [Bacteroides sp.]